MATNRKASNSISRPTPKAIARLQADIRNKVASAMPRATKAA